ncbi:hypothetical protein EJ02DRAFT_482295 [Clathrospora elynae]|uniref:Uncharacterized protein n=1 Tax=Clathrospora elynae TaxID=706981 RepID=A0A6A5S9E9_9PLEO|nr:hypothetical protein EJ02DRAFT_482295 [Clathrospora elynae]
MIYEINDKACHNNPVKHAAFATRTERQKTRGNSNNQDRNKAKDKDKKNTNKSSSSRKQPPHCDHCNRRHAGAGNNFWIAHPEKASPEWRSRNAEKLKASQLSTNAVAIRISSPAPSSRVTSYQPDVMDNTDSQSSIAGRPFAFYSMPLASISDQALLLAGRKDYRLRTICDTGATDHICNQRSKFIDLRPTDCPGIRTGGGIA